MTGERVIAPSLIVKTQLAKGMGVQIKSCTTAILKAWGSLLQLGRHIMSWTLGSCSRFRSRTSHDTIPWTPLPNVLLLLTLVPRIQCSFIMEKYLPPVHNKLVFLPLDQHSFLAVCLLELIWFYNQAPKSQELLRSSSALSPGWEVTTSRSISEISAKKRGVQWLVIIHFCSQGIMKLWLCRPGSHATFRAGVQLAPPALRELEEEIPSECWTIRVSEFWAAKKEHVSTSTSFQPFPLHSFLTQPPLPST